MAALNTPEVLEAILLALPMRDLLLAQRVCKYWQQLIHSSIHLQRALFLRPVPCGSISYIDWRLDDKDFYTNHAARLNLGEHLRGPERDQQPRLYPAHWGKTRDDAGNYQVFVNPLLNQVFWFLSKNGVYWFEDESSLPKAAQRNEASWRRMFFTQPPLKFMAIEYECDDDEEPHADWSITGLRRGSGTKGLTMDDLLFELITLHRPAWIEGRDHWKQYQGSADLGTVDVKA